MASSSARSPNSRIILRGSFPTLSPTPPRLILVTISRANTHATGPIDHATSAALYNYIYLLGALKQLDMFAVTPPILTNFSTTIIQQALFKIKIPVARFGVGMQTTKDLMMRSCFGFGQLKAYKLTNHTRHGFKLRFSQQYSNNFLGRGGSQVILKLSKVFRTSLSRRSLTSCLYLCADISR